MKKITFLMCALLISAFSHAQLNSVALVGSGAGGWPGEAGNPGPTDVNQMQSSDNINWTLTNITLTNGMMKFRGNNSWDLPYNWGGSDFPAGTAVENGGDIPSVAGQYDVTFNSDTRVYSFNTVLGIDEENFTYFTVFPNPAQDVWNFKSSTSVIKSIAIYNVLGKSILSVTPNGLEAQINVSELSNGLYFAKVASNNTTSTLRLLKK